MKKEKTLLQEDWDFSSCSEGLLAHCMHYEYGRQLAFLYSKHINQPVTSAIFKEAMSYPYRKGVRYAITPWENFSPAEQLELNLFTKLLYNLFVYGITDFPNVPFLLIPEKEIKQNLGPIKVLAGDSRPDRQDPRTDMLVKFRRGPNLIHKFSKAYFKKLQKEATDKNIEISGTEPFIDTSDGYNYEEIFIRINWSASNKKICKDFENLVNACRPAHIKPIETRGVTPIREKLKYLSAWRLIEAMPVSKAAELTQSKYGDPLYYTDTDWYKARDKARLVMEELYTPFFLFKNGKLDFSQDILFTNPTEHARLWDFRMRQCEEFNHKLIASEDI